MGETYMAENGSNETEATMKYAVYFWSTLRGPAWTQDLRRELKLARNLIKERGGELASELREPFVPRLSPTSPALRHLLECVKSRTVQAVVVTHWEQLGRDAPDVRRALEDLRASLGFVLCTNSALDLNAAQVEITDFLARINQATDDLVARLIAVGVTTPVANRLAQELVVPQTAESACKRLREQAEAPVVEPPVGGKAAPEATVRTIIEEIAPNLRPSDAKKVVKAAMERLEPDALDEVAKKIIPTVEAATLGEILADMIARLDEEELLAVARLALRRLGPEGRSCVMEVPT